MHRQSPTCLEQPQPAKAKARPLTQDIPPNMLHLFTVRGMGARKAITFGGSSSPWDPPPSHP